MVSEGVELPRLAVGVYATSASTPPFFAQAIGRLRPISAPRRNGEHLLPSVPNLLQLASEMEAERDHVLGKPPGGPGRRGVLVERRRVRASELDNGFESFGADAELDQVIFDGSSFGTATPAGRDEEADYLGVPGLLDAGRCETCCGAGKKTQLTKRTATGEVAAVVDTRAVAGAAARELNALVSIAHHRTGKPHGWIHNDLRRLCGGPPIAAATTDQLKARIEAVRTLQA